MPIWRLAASLVLVSVPALSFAQGAASTCKPDAEKFCVQVKGGAGPMMDCLIDHQKEISDTCYGTLKTHLENTRGAQSCKPDAEKFCKGMEPGGGRIVSCLVDHQKEISDGCYDFLKAKRSGSK